MPHFRRVFRDWKKNSGLPLLVTVLFGALWFIHEIPADVSANVDRYVWVTRLQALALVAYGVLYALALVINFFVGVVIAILTKGSVADVPPFALVFFVLIVYVFSYNTIGLLRRERRSGIMILIGFFGINVLCGLFTLVPVEGMQIGPTETCERFVTSTQGIRLTCFEVKEGGSNGWPDVALRLYSTQDGGNIWTPQTHMLDRYFWDQNYLNAILPDFNFCDCSNVEKLGDDFFWFWKQRIVAVTHDGGEEWYITQDWDVPYRRGKLVIGDKGIEVDEVIFENEQSGCARFTDLEYGYSWFGFATDDGGQTWRYDGTYLPSEGCNGRCVCAAHWQ